MNLASKLPHISTTIFTIMSGLAQENNALNLAQGFPDFSCPEELNELVYKYMKEGKNQYAPMAGLPLLRESLAGKIYTSYGIKVDPGEEITLTCGATEGIYAAITAVVKQGDEVIIFEPAFDSYAPIVELNGGIPVYLSMNYPDYKPNWEEVKKVINHKTRLIIINSPHNPTGAILEKSDMIQLQDLCKNTDILILSDEVYEHIIFDGKTHESVLFYPDLRNRSFILSSLGKTYHNTGWRMGYCVAPKKLTEEFRKIHQYLTFSIATPMQYAMADFVKIKEHYLGLSQFYQQKRDFFNQCLSKSSFDLSPSKGTYFQLLSYKNFSNKSDVELAKELTIKNGIACIPVSVFFHDRKDEKVLRFCFAKQDDTLTKATRILCRI
ncbi:MAG: methionine aminotransferase [Cytophagaceae bacterium]